MICASLVFHSCGDTLVLDHAVTVVAARGKHVVVIVGTIQLLFLLNKLNANKRLVALAASKTLRMMRLVVNI
jgi:hypothetical protein